jgi:hypothetical protein
MLAAAVKDVRRQFDWAFARLVAPGIQFGIPYSDPALEVGDVHRRVELPGVGSLGLQPPRAPTGRRVLLAGALVSDTGDTTGSGLACFSA